MRLRIPVARVRPCEKLNSGRKSARLMEGLDTASAAVEERRLQRRVNRLCVITRAGKARSFTVFDALDQRALREQKRLRSQIFL